MAICSFRFDFPIPADELVRRVGDAVRGAGGRFSGDPAVGRYSVQTPLGPINGTYSISGQTIWIDVTDKPFILPCTVIERKLNEYIRQGRERHPG